MKLSNWGKIIGLGMLIAASVAVAADLGIKVTTQKASWHYKITVQIETPEGLKTGSAVREVTVVRPEPEIQGLFDERALVKGEAVAIDLGKRGVLFALVDPDDSYRIVFQMFPGPPGLSKEGMEYYSHLKNAEAVLPSEKYGEFIRWATFKDLKDPKTIEGLYTQDLEKYFGNGVFVKQIKIEMTDAPVTWEIEKIIPSFSKNTGFPEWYGQLDYQDLRRIDRSQFIRR